MVSMRDVAHAAGVSVKTVSRVYTGDAHVSPDTRERVERAIHELGYVANGLASTFRTGRSPVIGIAVPDISDPFFAALVQGVDAVAAENRLITVVASIADEELERERVEALLSRRLQGFVLAPTSHDHAYLTPWAHELPIVFVDRQPIHLAVDWIESDDEHGAYTAVSHLIALGHRTVAFLGDNAGVSTTNARFEGYRRALEEAGIAPDSTLEELVETSTAAVEAATTRLLQLSHPPTAIFSSNSRSTMALVPMLKHHPVAVVSFGDFPLADALQPAISAMAQNPRRIGMLAAQRVLDRIEDPERDFPRRLEVPTTLIVRESSTGVPSGVEGDPN
ncbi:LacI family DNA-binding transcriptional regulator [Demequina aestuarii]|uniref:LacI family DNA-binding transcriptional regulator n=1 Tax=Demequina aestuarii TaxID=327095 RepID=UPI000782780B|nr:LacI family DNA-binding transcriptional regulator [Demequina aestuarii]